MSFQSQYGPWAVVVGASDGLGAGYAQELAARGVNVVLVARRRELLDDVARGLRANHGIETRVMALDAASRDAATEIARGVEDLDVGLVICNAASGPIGEFLDLTVEQLEGMLDLNCRLAPRLVHALGPRLVGRGRGGIILLGSVASMQGTAMVAHYAATKAYLRVLAEGLWAELKPRGVDVIACCPGLVLTPTYEASAPATSGLAPAPMPSVEVARQTFAALGRGPVVIPGWRNRLAVFTTQRLLPRRTVINLASSQTRAMYPR